MEWDLFFKTCKIVTSGFYNLLSLYFLFFASLNVLPRQNWTLQTFGSWVFFLISFCFYSFYCPVFISAQSLLVLPILVQLPW